jgi:hypothetical protein
MARLLAISEEFGIEFVPPLLEEVSVPVSAKSERC